MLDFFERITEGLLVRSGSKEEADELPVSEPDPAKFAADVALEGEVEWQFVVENDRSLATSYIGSF